MNESLTKTLINLISDNKEEDVYRYLHEQYYDTLLKFATAYLKSREESEEIVSDILFKLWEHKHKIADIQHLRLYLFTAVRNRCLTFLSKQKKERDVFVDLSENITEFEYNPEDLMITSELAKRIQTAVEKLPPRCRTIYKMIREEGQRNKDVAQQLGISVNTIDVQLALALKRIRHAIQMMYDNG